MNTLVRKMRGVTLLEVMLVLAIAAMIIVMSVRYYQTATSNQQANAVIGQVQALSAAADQLAQASGSYTGTVSAANLEPLLPTNGLVTPWGTTMDIATTSGSSYTIEIPQTPSGVCPLISSKLVANNHYTITGGTCGANASTMTFTYTANP